MKTNLIAERPIRRKKMKPKNRSSRRCNRNPKAVRILKRKCQSSLPNSGYEKFLTIREDCCAENFFISTGSAKMSAGQTNPGNVNL